MGLTYALMEHLKDEQMAHCLETMRDGSLVDLKKLCLAKRKENRCGISSAKESVLVLSLASLTARSQ